MTTGNQTWAMGRAVMRALEVGGLRFIVYVHSGNKMEFAVRDAAAAAPRGFESRAEAYQKPDGTITVRLYRNK